MNLIHLGQQEACDSLAKGQWLLAAACMEGPVVEEGWQQPEHRILHISLAFCILLLSLSVPVPPSPSFLPALGRLGHGEQLPWRSQGGGGPAGGLCGLARRRQTTPVVAIACPLQSQHRTPQPALLSQRQKMNWVGGSR